MFAAGKTKGAVATAANYIEDVFSTWLYTGTGATQTITNNIDLSTKGGMTWIKSRSAAYNHSLFDTARGATKAIRSNLTTAQVTDGNSLTAFNTTGFTLGSGNTTGTQVNTSAATFASWTFRKQPKFFDVVTYSGDGGAGGRQIPHNLGSVPGCMIVMSLTNLYGDPHFVYHRALDATNPQNYFIALNDSGTRISDQSWNYTQPTSTYFTIGDGGSGLNGSGQNYVAYLFAHNAGGFGLTGTDNVISCGSFTTSSSSGVATVNLGYEPQFVLWKSATNAQNWVIADNMRGAYAPDNYDGKGLYANSSAVENTNGRICPTSTGFQVAAFDVSTTYIYIAIRRGPMKVPTDATKVYYGTTRTGNGTSNTVSVSGFSPDLAIAFNKGAAGNGSQLFDRLRGGTNRLQTSNTDAEVNITPQGMLLDFSKAYKVNSSSSELNKSGDSYVDWVFNRAPGFFDEVCYTGNGTAGTIQTHNLGVVPELVILKERSAVNQWIVMCAYYNALVDPWSYRTVLNSTASRGFAGGAFNSTSPTATQFTLGTDSEVNDSGKTYVAYLFATCAGVSKCGLYIGTGSTQTIDCGFTGGARFVMIKRTDSTGDWYVYDTARGMTTLTDPYLLLNSTAAESATLGSVTTVSTGFAVNASILAAINTNGASYIYLSIA